MYKGDTIGLDVRHFWEDPYIRLAAPHWTRVMFW